jgi:hypothetical protein
VQEVPRRKHTSRSDVHHVLDHCHSRHQPNQQAARVSP